MFSSAKDMGRDARGVAHDAKEKAKDLADDAEAKGSSWWGKAKGKAEEVKVGHPSPIHPKNST